MCILTGIFTQMKHKEATGVHTEENSTKTWRVSKSAANTIILS